MKHKMKKKQQQQTFIASTSEQENIMLSYITERSQYIGNNITILSKPGSVD